MNKKIVLITLLVLTVLAVSLTAFAALGDTASNTDSKLPAYCFQACDAGCQCCIGGDCTCADCNCCKDGKCTMVPGQVCSAGCDKGAEKVSDISASGCCK